MENDLLFSSMHLRLVKLSLSYPEEETGAVSPESVAGVGASETSEQPIKNIVIE